jgi:membrane-bound metal-dependent hydrolase YbcI (DUF457 family)
MFNSTHTFVGLALARSQPDRWTPYITLTAVIAANLPDFEIITGFAGTPTYIQYHRGITHAFLGIPILSLGLALAVYVFSGNFWKTFLISLAAMATHPILDYMNTYGVRPFLPFNDAWYYGDILFVIDPYLDAILAGGVIAGYFFKKRRRALAAACLLLALAYIGIRMEFRDLARERLAEFGPTVPGFVSSAVLPQMLNPRVLHGVIETKDEFIKVRVDALDGVQDELARLHKGQPEEAIGHAMTSESAMVFMGFARFPVTQVEETETGYRVRFIDFRFYNERSGRAFAAEVLLNLNLDVMEDRMGFDMPVR